MSDQSEIFQAILMGIVEGLTEFIPVSSTGHLILFGEGIGFHGPSAATFEIFIQLGAILAVVFLYPARFTGLFELSSYAGFKGWQGLIKIALACLPAFVLGFLFHKMIKSYLFFPFPVALALIVGGVLFYLIDRPGKTYKVSALEQISYKQAFLIGVFQCFALWPGMSRSGSTIIGGLLLGLDRKVAAEFSFLVAVPVMSAAVAYDMLKTYSTTVSIDWTIFSVGFVVSFLTAILAIRFFIRLLGSYTLRPFGYYRIVLGALVLVLLTQ